MNERAKDTPPHVACKEARDQYDRCLRGSLRAFLTGADPKEASCEHAADVLRVCLARASRPADDPAPAERGENAK